MTCHIFTLAHFYMSN